MEWPGGAIIRGARAALPLPRMASRFLSQRGRPRHLVAGVVLAVGALAGPAAANHRDDPSPGAPGLGDRLFPTLGNGGYDARHYHPDLTYPTAAPQQYEGESVGTDEFIELAERVSRRDLSGFAQEWLFSTTVPPMPGHPDWELDPAGSDAPAPQARSQAMLLERRLHKH